jgi:hypothetical protein
MGENFRAGIEGENAPPARKAKPDQTAASISVEGALDEVGEDVFGGADLDAALEGDESAARRRIERQIAKRREFGIHAAAYVVVNLFLWAIYLGMAEGGFFGIDLPTEAAAFPWSLVVSMGWGAGLLAHGIETYYETGERAARRLRIIRDAYRREFGANWSRTASRSDLKRVRRRAEAPIKKRVEFFEHLGVYIMINLMLWVIYLSIAFRNFEESEIGGIPFPFPLVVMFFWGIGVVSNALEVFGTARRERAIERELERERALLDSEKPKRARAAESDAPQSIRLTQDGELTDSMIADLNRDDDARRAQR